MGVAVWQLEVVHLNWGERIFSIIFKIDFLKRQLEGVAMVVVVVVVVVPYTTLIYTTHLAFPLSY